jgi:hypothetical protein
MDVLAAGDRGRQLLYEHGYDVGEGFVDVLSQYQSLEEAHRAGRLRDLSELLEGLNAAPARGRGGRKVGQKKV